MKVITLERKSMYKRTLQLRVIKTPKSAVPSDETISEPTIDYAQIVHKSMQEAVIGIVVVIAATVVLNTISEITIDKFTSN